MDADGGAQPLADRPAVVGGGAARDTMMSFPSLPPNMVVGPQRVSNDLGDRAEARFGSASGGRRVVGRIDLGDENGYRTFRRGAATAALAATHELVRGAIEMRHEPTVDRWSEDGARPEASHSIPHP